MAKYRFDWTCMVFSRGHRSKFIWSFSMDTSGRQKWWPFEMICWFSFAIFLSGLTDTVSWSTLNTTPDDQKSSAKSKWPNKPWFEPRWRPSWGRGRRVNPAHHQFRRRLGSCSRVKKCWEIIGIAISVSDRKKVTLSEKKKNLVKMVGFYFLFPPLALLPTMLWFTQTYIKRD